MGYKGYIGAFVPADYASPCPGFNRGKTAPGGGRGSRSPPDIVISPVNVEFGEETFLCQIVNKFRNKGKWIFVGNCPFVQISVVLYGAEFAIFLLD